MRALLSLVVGGPIAVTAAQFLVRRRLWAVRVLSLSMSGGVLAAGIALTAATVDGTVLVVRAGGWPAPFAITLATDAFSALLVTVAGLMVLACTSFAIARDEDTWPFFHPLVAVLTAGVCGSFLTADLFNLFVWFEVMLIASYVLLTAGGSAKRIRAGTVYVTTNLLASTLLLAGIALTYGAVGTVNMAELGVAARTDTTVAVAGALLLVAFGTKSALVPVHGWLPAAYPNAPPATAALFSGLLTKVGVYALYRTYMVVLGGDPQLRVLLLWIASTTMVVGVLGAVGRDRMRDVLSFHITSQVGYMIMGLGLLGPLGLAGGIFYILHHIVVKTSLFLTAGAVETLEGTGDLKGLGGVARRRPVLALGFILAALSLAGLPPLSGFYPKLILITAAFRDGDWIVAGVAIGVGFLTLLSMMKIWNGVFWGDQPEPATQPLPVGGGSIGSGRARSVAAPAVALALVSLSIGLGAGWFLELARAAADGLLDPSAYIEAVR